MVDQDSDDYELMPSHELDDLRREVTSLKKGSMTEGDRARVLMDSMDRLTISINRLITILDDAQKDIIDEYQESKPAEKLSQLLEQNEMIAKALIAISDNINSGSNNNSNNRSILSNSSPAPMYSSPGIPSMPQQNAPMSNPRGMFPPPTNPINSQQMNMPSMNQSSMNQPPMFNPTNSQMSYGPPSMSSMDDLPPMDAVPPLDSPMPSAPKKKFLGIM